MISSEYYSSLISGYLANRSGGYTDGTSLKSDYNSIAKRNRNLPVYKINFSKENQLFTLTLKDSAVSLHKSMDRLSDETLNPFHNKLFVSSNTDSVDVSAHEAAAFPDDILNSDEFSFDIKVLNTATQQVNEGFLLSPSELSVIPGSYAFSLDIDEKSYLFRYNISPDTNNGTVMSKLADFITKTGVGVSAKVVSDTSLNGKRMVLTSDMTGSVDGLTFSLSDVSFNNEPVSKGLVSTYGMNNTVTEPTNARFLLNGVEKESLKNTFVYKNAMDIELKQPSEDIVRIYSLPDLDNIYKEVDTALTAFNSIMEHAKEAGDSNFKCRFLENSLNELTSNYSELLSKAGIIIDSEGFLSVDESTFPTPENIDALKELLTKDSPFVKTLKAKTREININPVEYLDKVIVTYPNTSRTPFSNPYVTSLYSGMIFNYYC